MKKHYGMCFAFIKTEVFALFPVTAKGSLQGYCRNYSGIPCILEYGNKSWVQNCYFTDYTCQLMCIITSCKGKRNRMSPGFCEEKCSETYNPLADRCNEVKRNRSSLYQICNTTKCNMTSEKQIFVTRQTCYCSSTDCGLKCNGINCTQKCQQRKTVASSSTSSSLSLPPTSSSLPSTSLVLPPSLKLQKLANETLIKLNRIDISNSSSLQEAIWVFEHFITGIENITKSVESLSGTEETKTLRRSIFRVAVAFEEFSLNYSRLHAIRRKSVMVIDGHRMMSLVVGIVYKDLHELLAIDQPIGMKTSSRSHFGSRIMVVTMDPKPNKLQGNVILKFGNLKVDGEKKCMFWSGFGESSDGFSERGCQVVASKSNSEQTVCSCNHFTHFALLVDYNRIPRLNKEDETNLEIITYAGLSLSIIGALLTIILHSLLM
ncbi:adhesion G-protein coupled receptor D1-like [Stylophora pistillata]|uniref:adhesion G-protein coupled receptor D1-like n=1 Tax=Stylophora pistillata TaxID=50429 RepID=UPI000C045B90|nr:adhesion G-protein coupled receptor D1-like [Stylophora pistillata]